MTDDATQQPEGPALPTREEIARYIYSEVGCNSAADRIREHMAAAVAAKDAEIARLRALLGKTDPCDEYHEEIARLRSELEARPPAPQPVGWTRESLAALPGVGWYSIDAEGLAEVHSTADEARGEAESAIEPQGEWPECIDGVEWGIAIPFQETREVDRVEPDANSDDPRARMAAENGWEFLCNYRLVDAAVVPQAPSEAVKPGSPLRDRSELLQRLVADDLNKANIRLGPAAEHAEPTALEAPMPLQVSREQWNLWLGTDQTLESLNELLRGKRPESLKPPELTVESVRTALKRSASGANELLQQTKRLFCAPDRDLRMGGSQAAERAPPSALEELQAKVEKLQERTERHHSVLLTVTGYCVFIATGESHDVSQEELIESLTSTLRGISLSALDAPGEGEVKP